MERQNFDLKKHDRDNKAGRKRRILVESGFSIQKSKGHCLRINADVEALIKKWHHTLV